MGALVFLDAFDFYILHCDLALARDVIQYRRPLRFKAKTALALAIRADTKVSNEAYQN